MARAFSSAFCSASRESSRRSSSSASCATARDCTTPSWSSSTWRCCVSLRPFSRSVSAFRRSNAPCRCWNSPKRRNVMSIALCSSSGPAVDDVRENAARRRLVDPDSVIGVEERDHRAERLGHDLGDLVQRVLGALAEADQRHIGALAGRDRGDVGDVDLARDHLVAEPVDHLCQQSSRSAPLIRDQDAKVVNAVQALPSVAEGRREGAQEGRRCLLTERASRVRAEIVANTTILHQSVKSLLGCSRSAFGSSGCSRRGFLHHPLRLSHLA